MLCFRICLHRSVCLLVLAKPTSEHPPCRTACALQQCAHVHSGIAITFVWHWDFQHLAKWSHSRNWLAVYCRRTCLSFLDHCVEVVLACRYISLYTFLTSVLSSWCQGMDPLDELLLLVAEVFIQIAGQTFICENMVILGELDDHSFLMLLLCFLILPMVSISHITSLNIFFLILFLFQSWVRVFSPGCK